MSDTSNAGDLTGVNGGFNVSNGRERSRETVLTSLTSGGTANITVAGNTDIKGATIATTDEDGKDTGQLTLKTGTLTYSDLSNTSFNSNMSAGLSTGASIGQDENGDTEISIGKNTTSAQLTDTSDYHKGKTLATIGQGNLIISDEAGSDDTTALNRDVENSETDLYTVKRQQGDFDVTIDHRFFHEEGWNEIKEEVFTSNMLFESLERVLTTERVDLGDTFKETENQLNIYNAVKQAIADDSALAAQLQDPNLTAEEKEQMLDRLTHAAMNALGHDAEDHENKIIAKEDEVRQGFYSAETQDSYINDQLIDSTENLVHIAGHEMSHAIDGMTGDEQKYSEQDRETYAEYIGDDLTDFTNMALDLTGHGGMAHSNNHIGNTGSTVVSNNSEYDGLDKNQGDNFIPLVVSTIAAATAVSMSVANPKVQKVTKQAFADAMADTDEVGSGILNFFEPDAEYTPEELDIAAQAYLQMKQYRDESTNTGDWVEMDNLMSNISSEVVARADAMSEMADRIDVSTSLPIHEGEDATTTTEVGGRIDASTETVVTAVPELWKTESPADSGVDPLLVVSSENAGDDDNQGQINPGDKDPSVENPGTVQDGGYVANKGVNDLLADPKFQSSLLDVDSLDCDDIAK